MRAAGPALALGLIAAALAGCQESDDGAPEASEDQVRIVASVNGEPISETMLELHVLRRTGQTPDAIDDEQRETLLLELVEMALIAQDAREHGLQDSARVEARMRNMHHAVLAQAMLEELKSRPIPEDEMREHFEQALSSGEHHKELHARHILVDSAERARELIAALDDGADFTTLAEEHSQGPTASRGGDLGWFVPGEMVDAFGEAALALEVGDYTREPVRTRYGYHVIHLEDEREREPPRYEDVAGHLERELTQERIESYVRSLRNEGDVELYRSADAGSD